MINLQKQKFYKRRKNMKFVHIADMHFDTAFTTLDTKKNIGDLRRLEQREVFKQIIEYIKQEQIEYFFIAGDLYEQEYIRQSTIEYINNLFKTIPNTQIFISPGNHDPFIQNSFYAQFPWNNNVHIFSSKIEKISTQEADIYGFGFNDFYCKDCRLENLEIENKNKLNILVIHGSIEGGSAENTEYNPIKKSILQEKGFDYIALGHIHKTNFNITENNNIIYPGSTISFGFDELGKHGMIVGNLEKNQLELNFIKLDNRIFQEINLDISNIFSEEELIEKLNELNLEENTENKIILIGIRNFEIKINHILKLIQNEKIIKIKNATKIKYNLEEISKENNLRGIFVKELLKKLEKEEYSKEEILQAIEMGLSLI